MSKGGGGGGTQTTTPWEGQQPYLKDLFTQAQNQYKGGPQQYFPDSTVAPLGPDTMQGLDMLRNRAVNGSPQQTDFGNYLSAQFNQPNIDPTAAAPYALNAAGAVNPAINMLTSASNPGTYDKAANMAGVGSTQFGPSGDYGPNSVSGTDYTLREGLGEDNSGKGAVPLASSNQLTDTANGKYLGANPYLDNVYDTAAGKVSDTFNEQIMPGINAAFGAGGRTGSAAQALTTGRAARDVASELRGLAGDIYSPSYEAERGRQINAANNLGNLGLGGTKIGVDERLGLGNLGLGSEKLGVDQQLGLGNLDVNERLGFGNQDVNRRNSAMNFYDSGLGRQLNAGTSMGDLGINGINSYGDTYNNIGQNQFRAGTLVPSYSGLEYGDIGKLLDVGNTLDTQDQRNLTDTVNRYNFNQQAPYDALNQYSNLIYGLPGGYGKTTGGGGSSPIQGALGGAASGAVIGSILPSPITGIGALAGGLLGAFS